MTCWILGGVVQMELVLTRGLERRRRFRETEYLNERMKNVFKRASQYSTCATVHHYTIRGDVLRHPLAKHPTHGEARRLSLDAVFEPLLINECLRVKSGVH